MNNIQADVSRKSSLFSESWKNSSSYFFANIKIELSDNPRKTCKTFLIDRANPYISHKTMLMTE